MGSYREMSDEPESFSIDTFVAGSQLEITQVIRAIGGAVEYDRAARHLDEQRARYKITLPAGCIHTGLDEYLAPQTIILQGGRALCVYPAEESVILGWLIYGFSSIPDRKALISRYRELSKQHHPDVGGLHEDMIAVNLAYDYLKKFL